MNKCFILYVLLFAFVVQGQHYLNKNCTSNSQCGGKFVCLTNPDTSRNSTCGISINFCLFGTLFICGIFGSIIGQGILSKYLNKKLIVGILGVTIFVAAFLMFSQGIYQSVMDYIHYGSLLHIKSPCDAHS
jgi:hypothetical protein